MKNIVLLIAILFLSIVFTKVQSQPMIVDFAVYNFSSTASTVTFNAGTTYQFRNLCTNLCEFTDFTWTIIPSGGSPTRFTINSLTASEPAIKFIVPGSYQVNLEAHTWSSSQGWVCANQTLQKNKIGYINVPYTAPLAQFKTDGSVIVNKTVSTNTTVNFTDASSNYPTAWLWTVSPSGGWTYISGNSGSQNPKIKFSADGNYTVSLKATNPAGNNTITKTQHITVTAIAPVTDFNANGSTAAQINVLQNATVNFNDLSTNFPTAWAWAISPATGWYYTSGSSATATPKVKFTSGGIYSVSLTSSNSGGSNSLTKSNYINVTPPPPTVSSNISYCKGQTAQPLSASGTNLKWYTNSSGGTGTNTAPTPSTLNAGTTSYYVSQTVNGVESLRSQIKVVVNATSPPIVSNRSYCQGAVTSALSASGTSLKWYPTFTGGTGSSSAPLPSSNTVGSTNYYVSQTLNGCESARATIVVTVVASLAAPAVASPVNYCKNAVSQGLSATGVGLRWYTVPSGGSFLTSTPVPSTAIAGTTSYYVSQSFNGCAESARSQIDVIVSSTLSPAMPVVSSPISYKKDSVAIALTATGSNLTWYTGGTSSSVAPIPSTVTAGNTSYFVTQTINGCESAGAEIKVQIVPPLQPLPSPDWTWVKEIGGSYWRSTSIFGKNITTDKDNNIYITGEIYSQYYNGTTLPFKGVTDIIVAKYSSIGNLIWAASAGGNSYDEGASITVDSMGNVYVTGIFTGTATFGTTVLTSSSSSGQDNFIAKYNPLGQIIWVKQSGGISANNGSFGIGVDGSGNSYITGYFLNGSFTFDNQTITTTRSFDMFLAKYNANGQIVWAKAYNDPVRNARGNSLQVDRSGNSYIANEYFVTKYNTAGTLVWSKLIGNGYGRAWGITIDDLGNSYITGEFSYTTTFGNTQLTNTGVNGTRDIFIAKYDVNGNDVWAKKAGSQVSDHGRDITLDSLGYIYITGIFAGTAGFENISLQSKGGEDVFIAKYNSFGDLIWVKKTGETTNDGGRAIVIDKKENCYVSGEFSNVNSQARESFDYVLSIGNANVEDGSRSGVFFGKLGSAPAEIHTNALSIHNYCINDSVVISFTTTGKFASDNIFTAQLSDSAGLFTSPIDLASDTLNTFSVAIPSTVTPGSKFRIRVIALNPATIGSDNGTDITINLLANPPIISTPISYCVGDLADTLSAIGIGIKWYSQPDSSSLLSAPIPLTTTEGNIKYYVSQTDGNGCLSVKEEVNVFINDLPVVAAISGTAEVCAGSTTQLANITTDGVWNNDTSGKATVDINGLVTGVIAGTGEIIYAVTINGCTSTSTINITTLEPTSSTINQSTCSSFILNGQTYTSSNTYTQTLTNSAGCDSVITLNLTINTVDSSVVINGNVLTASLTGVMYQWINCGNANAIIPNETNQSFTALTSGTYAVIITQNGCSDTSACFTFTSVGMAENAFGSQIKIYPSPGKGILIIEGDFQEQINITLTDVSGKQVLSKIEDGLTRKYELNTESLSNGMYLLKIQGANQQVKRKVSIIH